MPNNARPDNTSIRIGTRGSALARWQSDHVKALLTVSYPDTVIDIEVYTTRGDKILSQPLPELGGKGLFTAELEAALVGNRIDIAVHSLKDLPTENPEGLAIGAVPARANPADVLVTRGGHTLATLPRGATVGTSSPRRASQLLHIRKDLKIIDIRGNVDTRIRKALDPDGPYDAVVFAHAGLARLERLDVVSEVLDVDIMLPAPGQGALGVQCRDDESSRSLLAVMNDTSTELAVVGERAFLSGLGGGCALPICALGVIDGDRLDLRGRVLSADGTNQIDVAGTADVKNAEDAFALGKRLADQALANGADGLLGTCT